MLQRRALIPLALAAVVLSGGCGAFRSEPASATDVLRGARPALDWSLHDILELDIEGDGRADKVGLGVAADMAAIGVVLGRSRDRVHILDFSTHDENLGTCGVPASVWSHDKSPPHPMAGVLLSRGYANCESCPELTIGAGECDPLHVFWDHDAGSLGWWRM